MEPVLVMFMLQISLLVLCLVMFSDEKSLRTKIRSLLFFCKRNSNFDEFCEEKDESLPIELDFSVKDHLVDREVAPEAVGRAAKEKKSSILSFDKEPDGQVQRSAREIFGPSGVTDNHGAFSDLRTQSKVGPKRKTG